MTEPGVILAAASGLVALAGATPAQAGVVDGSLNEVHVLDGSNILGAAVGSKISDGSNNNANTRVHGNANVNVARNGLVRVGADVGPGRGVAAKSRRRA